MKKIFTILSFLLVLYNAKAQQKPNIVFILTDDMGYADLSCYGNPVIKTPFLDSMAKLGVKAMDFTTASPICTPSRAALLTGRYPLRMNLPVPLGPGDNHGIPQSEITIAEMLKTNGYNTAAIGKWHLGDADSSLPNNNGFDYFYGMLYSHDFRRPYVNTDTVIKIFRNKIPVISRPEDSMLIRLYTTEAKQYIRKQKKDKPFFLYLAHNMPHSPVYYAAQQYRPKHSDGGEYGDVIELLDEGVADVWKTVVDMGLSDNTIFIFSSDNGPWLHLPERVLADSVTKLYHTGTAGIFRGGKFETYEGGDRVPFIVYWKGRTLQNKVLNAPITEVDILPTLAEWTGTRLPDTELDGISISDELTKENFREHRSYYYVNVVPQVVRQGEWKLHRTKEKGIDNIELFNLRLDPGERVNLAATYPDKTEELIRLLNAYPNGVKK